MTDQFDDDLLQTWMQTHYGYGNYAGDYWFIGMEKGCRECDLPEIRKRFETLHNRGKQEVDDVQDYHKDLGIIRWFTEKPRLQPTWKGLIHVLLSAKYDTVTAEQVRHYQRDKLARRDGETCLLELLPFLLILAVTGPTVNTQGCPTYRIGLTTGSIARPGGRVTFDFALQSTYPKVSYFIARTHGIEPGGRESLVWNSLGSWKGCPMVAHGTRISSS